MIFKIIDSILNKNLHQENKITVFQESLEIPENKSRKCKLLISKIREITAKGEKYLNNTRSEEKEINLIEILTLKSNL